MFRNSKERLRDHLGLSCDIDKNKLENSAAKYFLWNCKETFPYRKKFAKSTHIKAIRFKMSKKKGLSLEEKRKRMLDIFYESKDVFLLKDLEKIAPKQKGIISQSVKDVVQSLVDDNLVDTDKIGTSVYFWAFPSKALAQRQAKLSALQDKLQLAKVLILVFETFWNFLTH